MVIATVRNDDSVQEKNSCDKTTTNRLAPGLQGVSFADIESPIGAGLQEAQDDEFFSIHRVHFSWFAYGRVLTILAIASSVAGFALSFLAISSYEFVQLRDPIILADTQNISSVGLMWMRVCFIEEGRSYDASGSPTSEAVQQISDHVDLAHEDSDDVHRRLQQLEKGVHADGECTTVKLSSEIMDDPKWTAARCFSAAAIALGGFLTLFLSTSIYWESINLRPVYIGLISTYLFQSISFLFYDSNLCRGLGCGVNTGTFFSIIASALWCLSALLTIRMDIVYRARQRQLETEIARRYKARALKRGQTLETLASSSSDDADVFMSASSREWEWEGDPESEASGQENDEHDGDTDSASVSLSSEYSSGNEASV